MKKYFNISSWVLLAVRPGLFANIPKFSQLLTILSDR